MYDAREETERGVRALVGWACRVRLGDIPEPALRRAVLVVADDLAAIVASRDEREVVRIHDRLLRRGADGEATLFRGGRPRTDRLSAAVGNAAAANWAELDEGYRKATCHAGLYTLPALFAEAEAARLGVGDLLRSAVVSYEIVTRFARAWRLPSFVLHPHATFAAVGAAAATALARRLDEATFLDALTSAATLIAAGPYDHAVKGALVRNMWAAAGAWNGMRSVDWAECGIGGLPGTPHDVYAVALQGDPRPGELTSRLGEEWAICDGYHKLFACCQYAHSAVEAARALLTRIPLGTTSARITRVVVETHRLGMSLGNYEPATTLAAKFSMPHCVAATLVFGDAGVASFNGDALAMPEVARLRKAVQLEPFLPEQAWPHDRPARVTVELDDGRTLTEECLSARGGPDRPLSEVEVLGKVSRLTGDVYPDLGAVVSDLLERSPARTAEGWDEVVARFTGGESR